MPKTLASSIERLDRYEMMFTSQRPSEKVWHMVRSALRVPTDSERWARALWYSFSWLYAAFYIAIGGIYLIGGHRAIDSHTLNTVQSVETSLHVHGAIMFALGLWFVYSMWPFRQTTKAALFCSLIYLFWTFVLICGQAIHGPFTWTFIPWYLLAIGTASILLILAPPLSPPVVRARPPAGERVGRA